MLLLLVVQLLGSSSGLFVWLSSCLSVCFRLFFGRFRRLFVVLWYECEGPRISCVGVGR